MRLLVLGGGGFLGHHVVAAALDAGHDVTMFSRSEKSSFDDVEVIAGDRTDDLSALRGRQWDAALARSRIRLRRRRAATRWPGSRRRRARSR